MATLKFRSPSAAFVLALSLAFGMFLSAMEAHAQANDWVDVPEDWDTDYRAAMQATADSDRARSCQLFRPYAVAGDAIARYFVGTCLINGSLGRTNVSEGINYLKASADGGFFLAQFDYGAMHVKGELIPKDMPAGIAYLTRAAKQGFGPAQVRLAANLASLGDGYSNLKAMEWVVVGMNGGLQGADLESANAVVSFLQKRMDRDDVAFATSQAQKFRKQVETPPQVTRLAAGKGKYKVVSRPQQKQESFGENDKPAFQKPLDTSNLKSPDQASAQNSKGVQSADATQAAQSQPSANDFLNAPDTAASTVPSVRPDEQEKALYAAYPYARLVFPRTNETEPQFRALMDERRAMIKAEAKRQLKAEHPDVSGNQADYLYREYLAKLSQQFGASWFPNVVASVESKMKVASPPPQKQGSRGENDKPAFQKPLDTSGLKPLNPATAKQSDPPELVVTWDTGMIEQAKTTSGQIEYVTVTTSSVVDLKGGVAGGGRIVSLTVDGSEAPIGADKMFAVRRAIPIGESLIALKVTDEWGRTSESKVKIIRKPESAQTRYPPLNPSRTKAKPRPNAVALIIGVDAYQSIPRAEFAENDARFFYDYAAGALGVPKDRIKLLTGSEARKLDVEKALLTWLKPLVAGGKSDVFVFFSGHGLASDDGSDLFLLPYDGDRSLLDRSAIRRKELVDAIVGAGATSATLFLDTCYSGSTRSGETLVASARPVLLAAKEEAVPANVTILTASANDQLSSTLSATGHGLFSYFLMRGLEGEAADGGRSLTAANLLDYLSSRIPPEAAKLGRSQTPQVVGDAGRVISTW